MAFDYPDQPLSGFLRYQGDVEVDAFSGETRIVNVPATTFEPVAAKTVFVNATNATAIPTFMAGSAAFQYLRVNSTNTGLEWAVLSVTSPITLTSGAIGFDQTVALGNNARVAVSKNSGATVGTRRRVNFIEGSNVTITVADDAVNEEVDVTIASSGSGSGTGTLPDGINLTATNETLEAAITGGGVADWEASFVDMSAGTEGSTTSNNFSSASNTVVAAPGAAVQRVVVHASLYCITAGSFTIQKDVAGTDIVLIGPLSLVTGERVEFTGAEGWRVFFADGSEKVGTGPTGATGPAGSGGIDYMTTFEIKDDFSYGPAATVSTTASTIPTGEGNWGILASGSTNGALAMLGESNHPGILRLTTSASINTGVRLYKNSVNWAGSTTGTGSLTGGVILFEQIASVIWVVRNVTNTTCKFTLAMVDNIAVGAASGNGCGFFYDSAGNLQCITVVGGVSTSTVTNVTLPTANTFARYEMTITPTSIVYEIDSVTVATHSTNLPTGVALTPYALIIATAAAAARNLDIDLFWLKSVTTVSR